MNEKVETSKYGVHSEIRCTREPLKWDKWGSRDIEFSIVIN